MKVRLDHIGIAVADAAAAAAWYRTLGLTVGHSEEVASQQVRAHFLPTGTAMIELLEATAPGSPIARFLEKRGPGLHHVALAVDDIHAAVAELRHAGVRLIDETPRPGAEGALVAFVHPSAAQGVLIELKQPASMSSVWAPRTSSGRMPSGTRCRSSGGNRCSHNVRGTTPNIAPPSSAKKPSDRLTSSRSPRV